MALFTIIDYIILIGLIAVSILIGIYFAFKERGKTSEEYLTGGKQMGIIPVVFSLMASYLTATTLIGWPVEVYNRGMQLFTATFANMLSTVIAAEIFLPIYFRINAISVNKYLADRFNSQQLVVVTSIIMTIAWLPALGIILFSPAVALGVAVGISPVSSTLLTAAVVTIYTTFGGVKAVIWTDFVQFILMMCGLFAIVVKGTYDIGGIGEVFERNNLGGRMEIFNFEFNVYMSNNLWTVTLGTTFVFAAAESTDQLAVQRMTTLPNIRKVKKALYSVMWGFVAITCIVIYLGMLIFAHFYTCDPLKARRITRSDEIVTLYVSEVFGCAYPGLLGLFVTSIFSSALSTLSSGYSALAALVWEDWLKKLFPNASESMSVLITKSVSVAISAITIASAFLCMRIGTIFEAIFVLIGAPTGPLFGLFTLGVAFPAVNAKGAISGLLSGLCLALWITIGSIVNKNTTPMVLPVTTDGCDPNLYPNVTGGVAFEALKHSRIPSYYPNGWNVLYHLSPFLWPSFTFAVTLIVGNIVSFFTGNNNDRKVDPILICDFVNKLRGTKISEKDFCKCNAVKQSNQTQTQL